jgi:hypothetical protein
LVAYLRRSIGFAIVLVLGAAVPAAAQQVFVPAGDQHDHVRVSGFIWRGEVEGVIRAEDLAGVAGFEEGVDVVDVLGLGETNNGWQFEVNAAPGKRHRFVFEMSRIEHQADAVIPIQLSIGPGQPVIDLLVDARTNLSLRDAKGFYNFLFVARPQVEAGVLAGVAYFDAAALVQSSFGSARAQLDTPYPIVGGNLMVNPQGPVRGYLEVTGFPEVEVDDLSGWQMDMIARVEVFVVRNAGVVIGYRRYHFVFEQVDELAIDLIWSGLTFGGQVRF